MEDPTEASYEVLMRTFTAILLALVLFGIAIPELRGDALISSPAVFDVYGSGLFFNDTHDSAYGYQLEGTGSNGLDFFRYRILSRKPSIIYPSLPVAIGTADKGDGISWLYVNDISIPRFDYSFIGEYSHLSFVDPLDGKSTTLPLHAFVVIKSITYLPVPPGYPVVYQGIANIIPTPEPGHFGVTLILLALIPLISKARQKPKAF